MRKLRQVFADNTESIKSRRSKAIYGMKRDRAAARKAIEEWLESVAATPSETAAREAAVATTAET